MRVERAGCTREVFASDAIVLLNEATVGAMRDLDRLAAAALRETARKKRKLAERDVVSRVIDSAPAPRLFCVELLSEALNSSAEPPGVSSGMDIAGALVDIESVMKKPSGIDTGGSSAVIAAAARFYACVCRYCPPGTPYRKQADRFVELPARRGNSGNPFPDQALYGLLAALKEDVASGKLTTFEELVHAEVYSDLLAQADTLQREGYHRAATVVSGAALEEHLKKLATKHGTGPMQSSGSPKKASTMNNELKGAGAYNEAQRATVEGWQKLRNDAAHGDPGFEPPDNRLVRNITPMIIGVRGFIAALPA